jgi:hypothetical protein
MVTYSLTLDLRIPLILIADGKDEDKRGPALRIVFTPYFSSMSFYYIS